MWRGRYLLLAAGGLALLTGLWTGLARVGIGMPTAGPAGAHGIVMTLGFLGTLIALERAVALRRRWPYVAPVLSALAVPWLLAGGPVEVAGALLASAGAVVVAVYVATLQVRFETHLAIMAAGAVAWVVAATSWWAGTSPMRLAPLLAAFLVLTIVGERLELSRLRRPSAASVRRLLVAIVVFVAGALVSLWTWRTGLVLAGVGLLGQTGWLLHNDIVRRTVRQTGLPRFVAWCLLAGYVWLVAGGLLWIAQGLGVGGLVNDAALHAVFLGFVMSMVMGHAPIIVPAVLRLPLHYHPAAYGPLVLLHASLAVRVIADLVGAQAVREGAAWGNVAALLAFVVLSAVSARTAQAPPDPVPTATRPAAARHPRATVPPLTKEHP